MYNEIFTTVVQLYVWMYKTTSINLCTYKFINLKINVHSCVCVVHVPHVPVTIVHQSGSTTLRVLRTTLWLHATVTCHVPVYVVCEASCHVCMSCVVLYPCTRYRVRPVSSTVEESKRDHFFLDSLPSPYYTRVMLQWMPFHLQSNQCKSTLWNRELSLVLTNAAHVNVTADFFVTVIV